MVRIRTVPSFPVPHRADQHIKQKGTVRTEFCKRNLLFHQKFPHPVPVMVNGIKLHPRIIENHFIQRKPFLQNPKRHGKAVLSKAAARNISHTSHLPARHVANSPPSHACRSRSFHIHRWMSSALCSRCFDCFYTAFISLTETGFCRMVLLLSLKSHKLFRMDPGFFPVSLHFHHGT